MILHKVLIFFSILFIFSCKTEKKTDNSVMNLQISPFTESQQFPDASISSMQYTDGNFVFGLRNYTLGLQTPDAPQKMCANSAQGQHIHLIVDNKPYEAKYDSAFHYFIPDGDHYILAFLSRSYHESIKNKTAFVIMNTTIKDSTIANVKAVTEPMLFYSRPKGKYVGDETKKVMLDFYLVNCNLGANYKVKAEINGSSQIFDKWEPVYLEGLPMGENTIKLSLIDSAGNLVNTPLNPVERKFTLLEDPLKK